jgi:hypothetical protein
LESGLVEVSKRQRDSAIGVPVEKASTADGNMFLYSRDIASGNSACSITSAVVVDVVLWPRVWSRGFTRV